MSRQGNWLSLVFHSTLVCLLFSHAIQALNGVCFLRYQISYCLSSVIVLLVYRSTKHRCLRSHRHHVASTSRLTTTFPNSTGCVFSYSGSSPIYASGSTVLPPITSGGPSRTLPCDWFLQFAYSYDRAQNSSIAALTSSKNASTGRLQSPTPTAPTTLKYKDPNLTGCYAETGGSTIFTLTSGDQMLLNPEKGLPTNIGAEPQTFTYACSEFFTMGLIPWHLKLGFAKSPACASYAREVEAFQSAQMTATSWKPDPNSYPPGVANGDAHIPFGCCGGRKLFAPEVQVYHWSTTSPADCSQTNATITSHASYLLNRVKFQQLWT